MILFGLPYVLMRWLAQIGFCSGRFAGTGLLGLDRETEESGLLKSVPNGGKGKGNMQSAMRYWVSLALVLASSCVWAATDAPSIAGGVVTHQDLFNAGMRKGVSCYRIPALVTAPNGDLVAAMDERVASGNDLGENKDVNIAVRRSADDGMTWSDIETAVDYDFGISVSDPSMVVNRKTGDIFLFYNYMDHNTAHGIYRLHVAKSHDNGASWSKGEDITPQITKPGWERDFQFITSGRGIQTRSGTLLHTLVNLKRGLYLFGSDDDGKSWFLTDSPLKPGDESKVVELADGSWMVNSRVKKAGMRYTHTSADKGKTWRTKPEPALEDPACNASFIRYTATADGYDKNRLLFSNPKSAKKRENMTVRVSYDEGATWTDGKTIYAGDSAYSSMTILKNGDIGLLFEKDDYTGNVFVRFSLEWLTDGRDKYVVPE
jgi:sialidase-1